MESIPTDVASAIRGRRTISLFKPELPPRAEILQAVELACWAPNHRTTEPWRFILLGPETAQAITELNAELVTAKKGPDAAAAKRRHWSGMPGWLVVTCSRSSEPLRDREDYAACACAVQNMALYLWSRGIGMKWSTGEVIRDPRFFRILDLDAESASVVGLFWYGYPAEIPRGKRSAPAEFISERP